MKKTKSDRAFTLIELLIVVAIIAVLALIAVPNFLEAQVRSKASRVKADLRTIATALETYATDNNNHYPLNDGCYNVTPIKLSTPISYITTTLLKDPFVEKEIITLACGPPDLATYYTYTAPVTMAEFLQLISTGAPTPPVEALDTPGFNDGCISRYGKWRLLSNGPDRIYSKSGTGGCNPVVLLGADISYDPTNGTVSFGNILRTQKRSDGVEQCP